MTTRTSRFRSRVANDDTSIWRKYFRGDATARRLGDLLDEDGAVLTHPFVVGELVLGGLATREETLIARLPAVPVVPHDDVLALVRQRKLARRAIGWIDAHLLASAHIGRSRVDRRHGPVVSCRFPGPGRVTAAPAARRRLFC